MKKKRKRTISKKRLNPKETNDISDLSSLRMMVIYSSIKKTKEELSKNKKTKTNKDKMRFLNKLEDIIKEKLYVVDK